MFLGLSLLFIVPEVTTAFTTTISAILFIFVWVMVLVAYLIYRKRRPALHGSSDFEMPFGVVMSWLSLFFTIFVAGWLVLEPDVSTALEIIPVWFVGLVIFYHRHKKVKSIAKANPGIAR